MQKKDFLRLSNYIIAIIIFGNIALLHRTVINLGNKVEQPQDVLAAKTTSTVVPSASIKELHIPFGGGEAESSEWADVKGVKLTIDSQNYKAAKQIVFETSFFIPTGNGRAFVRLYNVTDNYPMWGTELNNEGNIGAVFYMTSPAIQLAVGNKTYQVQIKNTLQAKTELVSSRLRVNY